MKKSSIGVITFSLLLICLLPFQNCGSSSLPDNLNQSSKSAAPALAQLSAKYFVGQANQTADLTTVGLLWKDVPGAVIKFTLPGNMTVDMRANGSLTAIAGTTYSSSHCGLRFVVDATPFGDATWGDVLVGVNGSTATTGWWTPWSMERHLALSTGAHTVQLQQTGWSGTDSSCKSALLDYSGAKLTLEAY